jgi:hypothetical protein
MFCDKSFKNVLNSLKIVFMCSLLKHQNFLFFAFILTVTTACNSGDQNTIENRTTKSEGQDSIMNLKLSYPQKEIKLSPEAEKATENWMLYTAMQSEIQRMKDYNVKDLISNIPSVLRVSDSLMKTVPKQFQTKAIESRIKVLHSKVNVVNQLSKKQQINYEDLIETANEVPVDFYNLNIQLNEAFIEMPDLN